jgi:hypothetical protein
MARMNENDEVDFDLCLCGHSIGDHDTSDGSCAKCKCKEFDEGTKA